MERRHPYRGFIIEAHPYELRDLRGWSVEFYIEKHDSSGVTVTRFYFDKPTFLRRRKRQSKLQLPQHARRLTRDSPHR